MVLKFVFSFFCIRVLFSYFFGQTGFPYDTEWKLIDSLMIKKNLPKSALAEVDKVYAAAKREKQEVHWVKAITIKIICSKQKTGISIWKWQKWIKKLPKRR